MDDYEDDMEIFAVGEEPPSLDMDGYETDDYFYYYDDSDQIDYRDSMDNDDRTTEYDPRNPGRSRSRGRSRGKGGHSAGSLLSASPSWILLSLCGLVNLFFMPTLLLASQGWIEILVS